MMLRADTNANIVSSAVLYGVAYWFTELVADSIQFAYRVYSEGWHNKTFSYFELGLFVNTVVIFCAALIVLLGQAFARPFGIAGRRHAVAFSAGIGAASSVLGWMVWGVSKIVSVEIPELVYVAFYFTMAVAASFVIVRFRWGNLGEKRQGFPVINEESPRAVMEEGEASGRRTNDSPSLGQKL